MDPLTALAVAGNILQFGQFVGGLLNNTAKICASASGITIENEHVQDVCSKLIELNSQLWAANNATTKNHGAQPSRHTQALVETALTCHKDCEQLIIITTKLKIESGKRARRWRSFRAALAEVWKSSEIEALRARIADRERVMILQLCAMSSENIQDISLQLKGLKHSSSSILNSVSSTSRLDRLFSALDTIEQCIETMRKQEPTNAHDIEALCAGISKLSLDTRQFTRDARVLASLRYTELPVRHENIPNAHKATLEWGLKHSTDSMTQGGSLCRWLSNDDGLFWVSGKPGSGKSTFMKYIADHHKTKQLLRDWSAPNEPVIVAHYFTIYGTPIQRSLEGLLRSLLYGIFKAEPRLIPKLLPEESKQIPEPIHWSQVRLESLLRRIAEEGGLNVNICFFVDGLDEYTGDHQEICQTFKHFSHSPSIKVCLSSRPWNVFEDALGDVKGAKLYMHELTHRDIRNYTESVLCNHPRWENLKERSYVSSQSLIEEVVSKSNGVFLWVTIVVRLLREGLTNDDSLSDLQRRLSGFPSDLDPFFRHILESVDPFYSQKMAGTLLLALNAEVPLSVEVYMLHDLEYDDEDYAFKHPLDSELMPESLLEFNKLFSSVFRRINGRCKGLLERNGDCIGFLHRTAFDFLKTPQMKIFLQEKAKINFHPTLSIFRAFVAWIKCSRFCDSSRSLSGENPFVHLDGFIRRTQMALKYAKHSDGQGENSAALTSALLDNMERSIPVMLTRGQISTIDPAAAIEVYRHLILETGVQHYLRQVLLVRDSSYLDNGPVTCYRFRSPIFSLLVQPILPLRSSYRSHLPCWDQRHTFQPWALQAILRLGFDPNNWTEFYCKTPWQSVIEMLTPCVISRPNWPEVDEWEDSQSWVAKPLFVQALRENVFQMLLNHKADPDALVSHNPFKEAIGFSILTRRETTLIPAWAQFLVLIVKMPSISQHLDEFENILDLLFPALKSDEMLTVPEHSCRNINAWRKCRAVCTFEIVEDPGEHEVLIRLFGRVLAKLPVEGGLCEEARGWFQMALPEYCHGKLDDAATAMRAKRESSLPAVSLKRGLKAVTDRTPTKRNKRRRK